MGLKHVEALDSIGSLLEISRHGQLLHGRRVVMRCLRQGLALHVREISSSPPFESTTFLLTFQQQFSDFNQYLL